jgi:hypothetical protein
MYATPIPLLLQILPHALPVLSIIVYLDPKAKIAIEKRRVDCMRETYFDVRVVRGCKQLEEGWGLWSRVLLEMDVWARVWCGLLSIRQFRLQPSLNSTLSESDSPPVLYEQSLDRLVCALGGRSVLPLVFQVRFSLRTSFAHVLT